MPYAPMPLTTHESVCLLFPELFERGGGLQRSVQERATLFAERGVRVLLLTTGFTPRWSDVPAQLKARGALHPRVEVRNFFAHSAWASRLGVPPPTAYEADEPGEVVTRAQRQAGVEPFRLADFRRGERLPFRYRYFDTGGELLLITKPGVRSKHEQTGVDASGRPVGWSEIVAGWVDDEIADLPTPVLFSLQRGVTDPVLLASRRAARKVASLHNCHYNDPEDRTSGIRPSFRLLFANASRVDRIVCQTEQQLDELRRDVPWAPLQAIRYPGRLPQRASVEKDPTLVVLVSQLIERKRVDHAIRAFAEVVRAVPGARLEIYGEGPLEARLRTLVDDLGLAGSVRLLGYSLGVGDAQARAACVLLTSSFEGSPRVVTESMSRGTPAVAYTIRYGPRDLIRHGVDGLLVERHEPDALAEAIVSLVSDSERVAEMGRRAAEVVERFPVADFEQAWHDVLTAPARPRTVLARARELAQRARASRAGRGVRRLARGVTPRCTPGGRRATGRSGSEVARVP